MQVMKKIIIPISLFLLSCSSGGRYSIVGSFDGDFVKEGTVVRLYDMYDEPVDSAVVKSGSFVLEGKIDEPSLRYMEISGRRRIVACQQGETVVTFDEDLVPYMSGTDINGRINTVNNYVRSQYRKYMRRTERARAELSGSGLDSALAVIKRDTKDDIYGFYGKCVEENRDNIVSGYVMLNWAGMLDAHEIDSVLGTISCLQSRELPPVVAMRNRKHNMERSAEGRSFIDIIGADASGNPMRLSDTVGRGRPAVLFFWASWCGECLNDTALLKAMAERYGDDGPVIVGINVREDSENDFRTAINVFGMSWPHVHVRDNTATDAYAVNELPFAIAVDSAGTIVRRSRHLTDVEAAVDSLMSAPRGGEKCSYALSSFTHKQS